MLGRGGDAAAAVTSRFNHGSSISGVNRLSSTVFVRAIKDKSWNSLRPVILEMLNAPEPNGFEGVEVLYSDGESALSEENVRQLKTLVPRLRKVVRFKPQQGKAFAAERAIGVFKRVLSALLRRSDIWLGAPRAASLKDWRRVLVESVQVMNHQR